MTPMRSVPGGHWARMYPRIACKLCVSACKLTTSRVVWPRWTNASVSRSNRSARGPLTSTWAPSRAPFSLCNASRASSVVMNWRRWGALSSPAQQFPMAHNVWMSWRESKLLRRSTSADRMPGTGPMIAAFGALPGIRFRSLNARPNASQSLVYASERTHFPSPFRIRCMRCSRFLNRVTASAISPSGIPQTKPTRAVVMALRNPTSSANGKVHTVCSPAYSTAMVCLPSAGVDVTFRSCSAPWPHVWTRIPWRRSSSAALFK